MESRKIIDEKITFPIKDSKEYKDKPFCTWEELIVIKGLLPGDQIYDFHYEKDIVEEGGWGEDDDYPKTYYTPSVNVIRPRKENDEEYEKRMKEMNKIKRQEEEKERLEYLRLKAKFEK